MMIMRMKNIKVEIMNSDIFLLTSHNITTGISNCMRDCKKNDNIENVVYDRYKRKRNIWKSPIFWKLV